MLSGAPDPTAGSSANEISVWCLDEPLLQENIHKTLSKFILPSPHVVSDIDYLAHSSSAASAEYTSLLRPLRGREPEGMWNLISILKELLRKRDKNSIPLLRIITTECVNLDLIIQLWFLIKVSPLYNERGTFNQRQNNHHTPPVHQACATLLDEIISLWRIACLNPVYSIDDKNLYKELLTTWQKQIYDKMRKFCNSAPDKHHLLHRLDPELFPAFSPSIDACEIGWSDFDFKCQTLFKRRCIENLPEMPNIQQIAPEANILEDTIHVPGQNRNVKSGSSSSEGFYDDNIKLLAKQASEVEETVDVVFAEPSLNSQIATTNAKLAENQNNVTALIQQTLCSVNLSLNTNEHKRLESLFSRCEALYAHGYIEHACILAKILAEYLLASYDTDKIYDDLINCKSVNCSSTSSTTNNIIKNNSSNADSVNKIKYITNFQSSILWRSVLLSTVLLENSNNNHLAFRIGILSLEMPRQPASTKALEVKLFNQEQDLVQLLKRIPIGESELSILRDKCKKVKEYSSLNINFNKCKCNNTNYLPIVLSSFIFEVLSSDKNSNCSDELIGFDAAVAALGYKPNVSETQHAIYCEGIRRQKGDLAINLLLTYKDDQARLLKIMDKILDKEIHVLFKSPTNPFQPNLKRIQQKNDTMNSTAAAASSISDATNKPSNALTTNISVTNVSPTKTNQISKTIATTPITPTTATTTTSVPTNELVLSNSSTSIPTSQLTAATTFNATSASTIPSNNGKPMYNTKYSAIDSLSSGWDESESEGPNQNFKLIETNKYRCLNLNKQNNVNNKKVGAFSSFDSSAPETTSSDNSPTMNRKANWQQNSTVTTGSTITSDLTSHNNNSPQTQSNEIVSKHDESDNDSGQSLSSVNDKISNKNDDNCSSIVTIISNDMDNVESEMPVNMTTKPWADGSFNEYTTENIVEKSPEKIHEDAKSLSDTKELNELFSSMLTTNPNDFVNFITHVTSASSNTTTTIINASTNKKNRQNQGKNKLHIFPNQPSEALAHFMFDFSKTLLGKAGGPISTSVFLNQNNTGPHRNLHICAFIIAIYALGLQNCVQTNWLSRTYSSHVSWINGQAADIGYPAICILIECWVDHLTPSECVSLADRVSRGRDTMAVKAAAELALSSLKYSHSLTLQEIQRALVQCKEQSNDMLQRACLIVENSVKEGNNINLADVLFEVAKRWHDLYNESMRNNTQNQLQSQNNQIINEPIVDPAIVSSSISSSCLQQQAAAVAAAAAAASNSFIQQQPMMQHQIHSNMHHQQPLNMVDPTLNVVHPQFSYMQQQIPQQQQQQAAPFAFQVQTLPYPQYVSSQSSIQNSGPIHVPQNIFIPHMYTAYGTIVPTPQPPQHSHQQNMLYSPQNQNIQPSHNHPYSLPQMNIYPANNYLFQNQITQVPLQTQPIQPQQKPLEVNNLLFLFSNSVSNFIK